MAEGARQRWACKPRITHLRGLAVGSILIALSIPAVASGAFQEDGTGLVAMEAEHFHANTPQGGHSWDPVASPQSGYSGDGTLRALPEDKINQKTGYAANSPRLDFQVEFNTAGTHHVWVRGIGPGGGSNSMHVGLDGQEIASAAGINLPKNQGYIWSSGTHTLDIPSPGVYTVNVWMRESGTILDKIVLSSDPAFTPTGSGPPESTQGGLPTVATPTISPAGGSFTDPVVVTLTSATPGALLYYTLDGSTPTAASAPYSAPITLSTSATLKVRGSLAGYNDSPVASASFTIASNPPPVLGPIGDKTLTEGQNLMFTVTASDPNGTPVLSISAGQPSGASFTPATGVFDWTPASGSAGTYQVTFRATDDADPTLFDEQTITITVNGGGGATSGAFQEDGTGLVAMEAEHFHANTPQGGHSWDPVASPQSGYSGDGTLRALPEDKINQKTGYAANSPRLDFQVEFNTAGTHHVWVRGIGPGGGSNSMHVGLDGQEIASAAGINLPKNQGYIWSSGTHTLDIPSPGVYTVNVWMRESGTILDKIVLSSDPAFTPTGSGPPESTQCASIPSVAILSPTSGSFQSSSTLITKALTCLDPAVHVGWGVRFALDGGPSNGGAELFRFSAPFEVTFTNVTRAEHTLDAYIVDPTGVDAAGANTHDRASQLGVGDYYVAVGDSITAGAHDDDPSDDVSADGRTSGGGFEPVLNDRLTNLLGYPNLVANEGIPGDTSAGGLDALPAVLSAHPQAQFILVDYGMNDARPWLPVPSGLGLSPGDPAYPGTFKDNLQQIIDLINAAGKTAVLAKTGIALGDGANTSPYPDPNQGARSLLIQEYAQVVDELASDSANRITIQAPDFFTYFSIHYPAEYFDNIHPNGLGYRSMADIWLQILTQ